RTKLDKPWANTNRPREGTHAQGMPFSRIFPRSVLPALRRRRQVPPQRRRGRAPRPHDGGRPATLSGAIRPRDGSARLVGPRSLPDRGADSQPPVPLRPPASRRRPDRDRSERPLPIRGWQDARDVRPLEGHRPRPADGRNPGRPVLPDDGGGEPSPDGSGPPTLGPQDGPPERHVRSRPGGGSRPDRPTRDPRDRREDGPLVRRRDPQGRQDRVHVEGSPGRVPAPFASRRRGIAVGSI